MPVCMTDITLPPESNISVRVKRGTQTECAVELLVNEKVFGSVTLMESLTGEFTLFGFRTPKSGNTIINIDKSRNLNFKFSAFGKLFGFDS